MKNATQQIPSFWFLGFSGHRNLSHSDKVDACITQELIALERMVSGRLVGISSCADGADKAFLKACQKQNIPFQVYLPLSEEDFRKDFTSEGWKEVEELVAHAVAVQRGAASVDRQSAYLDCGMEVVDDSDVVMVVWDGNSAAGKGGTGDIVEYARSLKKPLIWIHSASLEVSRENLSEERFQDSQHKALCALFEKNAERNPPPTTPRATVEQLLRETDAFATRAAPQIRGMAGTFVICALALVISGTLSGVLGSSGLRWGKTLGGVLDVVNLLLFLFIFIATVLRFLKKRTTNWLLCRFIAEFSRSTLATWEIPSQIAPVPNEAAPDFQHMIRSIAFSKVMDRTASAPTLHEIAVRYVENRILPQKRYYLEKSQGLAPQEKRNRIIFWAATILGGVFGLLVLLTSILQRSADVHCDGLLALLRAGVSIFPTIATSVLSITFIREIGRRLAHNQRMIELLEQFESQALHCTTLESLARIAERTERSLMGELLDWYYYNRYGR